MVGVFVILIIEKNLQNIDDSTHPDLNIAEVIK